MQRTNRKRPYPFEDPEDRMVRTTLPRPSEAAMGAISPSDQDALERVANLFRIPKGDLFTRYLQTSPASSPLATSAATLSSPDAQDLSTAQFSQPRDISRVFFTGMPPASPAFSHISASTLTDPGLGQQGPRNSNSEWLPQGGGPVDDYDQLNDGLADKAIWLHSQDHPDTSEWNGMLLSSSSTRMFSPSDGQIGYAGTGNNASAISPAMHIGNCEVQMPGNIPHNPEVDEDDVYSDSSHDQADVDNDFEIVGNGEENEIHESDYLHIESSGRPGATSGSLENNESGPGTEAETENGQGLKLIHWDPSQPTPRGRQQQRGPYQDKNLKLQTGITRKLKACIRCRMQKIRCHIDEEDPTGCCLTCKAVSNQKIHNLPCFRHRITECTFYRTGRPPGMDFTSRWRSMKLKDITSWASSEVRTIHVMSDVCMEPLELSVRKFIPIPKDSLHRAWMDGKTKKFKETTPFAIVNMTAAAADMHQYLESTAMKSFDHCLKNSDELIKMTFTFARKHMERCQNAEEKRLMGNYFAFWVAARRTFTIEHIVGKDKLDMQPEMTDKSFPLFGKVPLPPVMIQQLDMILTLGILEPLRKKVVEDLQKIIMSLKPRSWLTIYLVTFLSLQACAAMTDHHYKNARKHGLRRRYLLPTFISDRHHSANVFLSHFHYRTQPCNPFHLEWKNRQSTVFADLTPDEILFLEKTKKMVKEKEEEFKMIKEHTLYEHPLYFISQMFEDDWTPRDTVIDFNDGTIGDVPLAKYHETNTK